MENTTLIYTGGNVVGYTMTVGDKYKLIGQYEVPSNGILVKLFHVMNVKTKHHIYMTPKEYVESMELIS